MAPTAMKTVPSGRLDFFMNGASLVSGTTRVGMGSDVPASVGKSVATLGNAVLVPVVDAVVDVEEEVVVVVAGSAAEDVMARIKMAPRKYRHVLTIPSCPLVECAILIERLGS